MKKIINNTNVIILSGPAVVYGLLVAVSVASPAAAYVERQRVATPEHGNTTPWRNSSEADVAEHHIGLVEMVVEMKANGFPVASIAHFAGVERKTVYSWLDGATKPHIDREERVSAVYPLLKKRFSADFNLMYRVWRSKNRDGESLESIFSHAAIDINAVQKQLGFLHSSIENLRAAEVRRKTQGANTAAARNGFVDDSPEATFDRV
ncbi:hypothetical protein [Rhizobium sp. AG207R]|uniref:hypothetical protein n=1 Tax=Rhizobium sp. AG207R TaxID=2802287 RepID=UPI0022AC5DBC|nr:hypothetical protein [Rhizobium sp. AG207R]MCZ3380391.1 hypothetical protein [Rhizobium sp. AG207R]